MTVGCHRALISWMLDEIDSQTSLEADDSVIMNMADRSTSLGQKAEATVVLKETSHPDPLQTNPSGALHIVTDVSHVTRIGLTVLDACADLQIPAKVLRHGLYHLAHRPTLIVPT
jgi:hypothetical protein